MAWVLLLQACIQVGQFQLRCSKRVIQSKIVIKFKACSPDVAWNYLSLISSTHVHQSLSKCNIGAMLSWHHFSMPGDGRPRGEIETFVAQSGHVTGQRTLHLKSFGMEIQTYIHLILASPLWVSYASRFPWWRLAYRFSAQLHLPVEASKHFRSSVPVGKCFATKIWKVKAQQHRQGLWLWSFRFILASFYIDLVFLWGSFRVAARGSKRWRFKKGPVKNNVRALTPHFQLLGHEQRNVEKCSMQISSCRYEDLWR